MYETINNDLFSFQKAETLRCGPPPACPCWSTLLTEVGRQRGEGGGGVNRERGRKGEEGWRGGRKEERGVLRLSEREREGGRWREGGGEREK